MEFNLAIYLIGVVISIVFGLRAVGVFNIDVKYYIKDIIFVMFLSMFFHWFGAMIFFFGYDKPSINHPDVI